MTQLDEEQTQENRTYNNLLLKIIPVPDKICGTGYIKIVGINSEGIHSQNGMRWEFKARCHDPTDLSFTHASFDVTQLELDEWLGVIE